MKPEQHLILVELAAKAGSKRALASLLEVSPTLIFKWLNLQDYPAVMRPGQRRFDGKSVADLDAKLAFITPLLAEDIWDEQLRYSMDLVRLGERELSKLQYAYSRCDQDMRNRLTLPHPVSSAVWVELREAIQQALSMIVVRYQWPRLCKVIDLRFGLTTRRGLTLAEIGAEFGVTPERIRQMESKAIRILQQPSFSALLEEFDEI